MTRATLSPHTDSSSFANTTDEELALRARCRDGAGAEAAFEELVARLEGPLFGFLYVRVGNADEAEELVQDALLRAWSKLDLFDDRWRFRTWLFTLAKRLAVSRARVRRPEALGDEAFDGLSDSGDPLATVSNKDEASNVWRLAAELLPADQRSALWLRYAEERTNEEIAEILDKKRVTVRVLLFRARAALGAALGIKDSTKEPALRTWRRRSSREHSRSAVGVPTNASGGSA